MPAHPRSRGENSRRLPPSSAACGSSPLTRGKQLVVKHGGEGGGLIPAHAGKTRCAGRSGTRSPAHPRSRGENGLKMLRLVTSSGSSPLTRGKRFSIGAGLRIVRLIPAHAGKTGAAAVAVAMRRAHPRSRGENGSFYHDRFLVPGSSPLTRGKPRQGDKLADASRLIPAHAGKTDSSHWSEAGQTAHPRSRGENQARAWG